MTSPWQPFREPLRATLLRTGTIAVVGGAILSHWWGGLSRWPAATLLMLWPSFGGHWIELWFLNWLRPRLPSARPTQVAARLTVWFVGGVLLAIAMALTATAITGSRPLRWPVPLFGGLAFIGVELFVHMVMQVTRRPNFYNGRG